MTYVCRPNEVEAVQFVGTNIDELAKFVNTDSVDASYHNGAWSCVINTPLLRFVVLENDYIIKDEYNELSVMKPDIFNIKYMKKE